MILGTACVSYTHDLSDAPAGRLNVHVYKNGAQSETLNTHTVGSKTTSKAQFSAGSSDLTEVSKIFVYVDTLHIWIQSANQKLFAHDNVNLLVPYEHPSDCIKHNCAHIKNLHTLFIVNSISLLQIVFEVLYESPRAYAKEILISEIHLAQGSCPTGELYTVSNNKCSINYVIPQKTCCFYYSEYLSPSICKQ